MTQPDSSDAAEALMTTSRVLVGVVVRSLAAVAPRVTVAQLRVLVMVSGAGVLTVNEIAAGLGVNASSASRTCERLVRAKLLQRTERPEDRRHSDVSATHAGRAMVDEVMSRRRSEIARLLEGLSGEELDQLHDGLAALNRAAERLTLRDRGPGGSARGEPSSPDADHHLLGWMA